MSTTPLRYFRLRGWHADGVGKKWVDRRRKNAGWAVHSTAIHYRQKTGSRWTHAGSHIRVCKHMRSPVSAHYWDKHILVRMLDVTLIYEGGPLKQRLAEESFRGASPPPNDVRYILRIPPAKFESIRRPFSLFMLLSHLGNSFTRVIRFVQIVSRGCGYFQNSR